MEVEKLLPQQKAFSFVDIGSGLGGLILYLAGRFESASFIGVEIAPLPWLASYLRVQFKNGANASNAQFLRSNYENLDFSKFDVVFAYLSPAAMSALWQKAKKEMRPGSILISYEFPILGIEPDLSINVLNNAVTPAANKPAFGAQPTPDVALENMSTNVRKLHIWYL